MIILLLAPYIFLLIDIGICVEENGFTADAIEMIGWTFMGMFLLILFPNMIYAFVLKRCGYGYQKLFFWNMLIKLCNIPIYVLDCHRPCTVSAGLEVYQRWESHRKRK